MNSLYKTELTEATFQENSTRREVIRDVAKLALAIGSLAVAPSTHASFTDTALFCNNFEPVDSNTPDLPLAATLGADPQVSVVASGLTVPWDVAFLPAGDALFTERSGRVRYISASGQLQAAPVLEISALVGQRESGLLGMAADPDFLNHPYIYVYYTESVEQMRLIRYRWDAATRTLVQPQSLVNGIRGGEYHNSGRMRFGPDSNMYLATGDSTKKWQAQRVSSPNGKILLFTPAQYRGATTMTNFNVYARGLRNPQGMDWHPQTGLMVSVDHGPTSCSDGQSENDELNIITSGGNYGWPVVSGPRHRRYISPALLFRVVIAPGDVTFVRNTASAWFGDAIIANLRGQQLRRVRLSSTGTPVLHEKLLVETYGRLRTVVNAPDGSLWVLTSNEDGRNPSPPPGGDRILRIQLP